MFTSCTRSKCYLLKSPYQYPIVLRCVFIYFHKKDTSLHSLCWYRLGQNCLVPSKLLLTVAAPVAGSFRDQDSGSQRCVFGLNFLPLYPMFLGLFIADYFCKIHLLSPT